MNKSVLAKSHHNVKMKQSSTKSVSNSRKTHHQKNKKWTAEDIKRHQYKMADGIIPWEEIWEVPGTYTVQEYYDMMDEDSHWELVDNKILVHSPAGMEHQDIVGSLYTLIRTHVTIKQWGIAYTAPAGLEIEGLSNKFEPDIFAISQEKSQYVKGSFCEYVPELVIEVALTKKALNYILEKKFKKFDDYARIGILEYLVVYAPKKGNVQYFHYTNEKGCFIQKDNHQTINLKTIGLSFPSFIIQDREYWRQSIIDQFIASTLVEKMDPKVRVNGVDPNIRVNGVDPKIRVNGVDPNIRVNGVDPKIRVNGVDPNIRVNGVDPNIRVNGVDPEILLSNLSPQTVVEMISQKELAQYIDPKVRVEGVDINTRLEGLTIEEIKKYIAENES